MITTKITTADNDYLNKALNSTTYTEPKKWNASGSWTTTLKDCNIIKDYGIKNYGFLDGSSLTIKDSDTSKFYTDDMLDYLLKEVIDKKAEEAEKKLDKMVAEKNRKKIDAFIDTIDKVYFNNPATVIKWKDGTKTVVKCQKSDTYDAEKGFAMALIKGLFDNSSYFNTIFEKWLPKED